MGEVSIDVGMVELDAGQNDRLRAVVKKFWALIKKGRVVFITLDDEEVATSRSSARITCRDGGAGVERTNAGVVGGGV